jgi:hypothetical protein
MEFNSRIMGLKCVEGHFEQFLPSPTADAVMQGLAENAQNVLERILNHQFLS